jgi:CheY-like chemotaxis protein
VRIGACILVVDDDGAILEMLELLLLLEGYEVVTLQASHDTCHRAALLQPALVIHDVQMEQPDAGWRVLRQLRATPTRQHIPMLIASAEPSLEEQAARIEVNHFVTVRKPFVVERLLEQIRRLVQP